MSDQRTAAKVVYRVGKSRRSVRPEHKTASLTIQLTQPVSCDGSQATSVLRSIVQKKKRKEKSNVVVVSSAGISVNAGSESSSALFWTDLIMTFSS